MNDLLTTTQAADYLGVTTGWVRRLLIGGTLQGTKMGPRAWLIKRGEVDRYRRERRPVGRPPTIPANTH